MYKQKKRVIFTYQHSKFREPFPYGTVVKKEKPKARKLQVSCNKKIFITIMKEILLLENNWNSIYKKKRKKKQYFLNHITQSRKSQSKQFCK